jgi:hypothetical protein
MKLSENQEVWLEVALFVLTILGLGVMAWLIIPEIGTTTIKA